MKDDQRIYAAVARARDKFCVAVVEPEDGDPFTYLLTYDGASPQPWARVDVQRVVNSVTVMTAAQPAPCYAAVSDEGDVFLLQFGAALTDKVVGAGILSTDATGLGAIKAVTEIGGHLYVAGDSAQLYRCDAPGDWVSLPSLSAGAGYSNLTLRAVQGSSPDAIYVAGAATPATRKLTAADYKEMEEAGARDDIARILAIMASVEDPGTNYTFEGMAFFWNGAAWSRIALAERHGLHDILIEAPDKVWLTGFHGTILQGDAMAGFNALGSRGDTERILSFTRFGDRYAAASDNALHWFNGHNLSTICAPRLTGVPFPLRVQGVDDVLFYFDYLQGVHRFDGAVWEDIPIPPALLERDFQGLDTL